MIVSVLIANNKAEMISDLLMNTEIFGAICELPVGKSMFSELRAVCRKGTLLPEQLETIKSVVSPFGKQTVMKIIPEAYS